MHNDAERGETGAHGRYDAEYLRLNPEETLAVQALLDEKDGREWPLVRAAGCLPENGAILFWDTRKPSFGRGTP